MIFKILIYDKFPVIRKGLGFIITKYCPNSLITYSKCYEDFFTQIIESKFNLVLADITYEDTVFFDLILNLLPSLSNKNRIIVFVEDANIVSQERCSLISPYIVVLNKNSSENDIVEKIQDCLLFLEIQDFISNLAEIEKNKSQSRETPIRLLSVRELEFVILLLKGYSNVKIAKKLMLSNTTVSTYKKRVFLKTKTNNVVELTRLFSKKNIYSSVLLKYKVF